MRTDYENFERSDGGRRLLRQESLIMDVLEELNGALESENISRNGLSQRLGKTKGFVSQILSGGRNLTLRTVADVCWAIGYIPHFELTREKRNFAALPSFHNMVRGVEWAAKIHEMEMKKEHIEFQVTETQIPANQELELVA